MGGGRNTGASLHLTRTLPRNCLGGAIFGCTNATMQECLTKQLFGLPSPHFSFVANISPGLPLFLFNYSDRKMHGIYEAASNGQMNIDPYAWTDDNANETTPFPAQVRINVKTQCLPLSEDQFRKTIEDNYQYGNHFWFQLDHKQAKALMSLFKPVPVSADIKHTVLPMTRVKPVPEPALGWKANNNQLHNYFPDLNETVQYIEISDIHNFHQLGSGSEDQEVDVLKEALLIEEPTLYKVEEKAAMSRLNEITKLFEIIEELTQKTTRLEIKQATLDQEIQQLHHGINESGRTIEELRCKLQESVTINSSCTDRFLEYQEMIYLIGGFDGSSFLSTIDSFPPSRSSVESLKSMACPRAYASAAALEENIYVFGGGDRASFYDTVECYNRRKNEWTACPKLNRAKGCHAAVTLRDKLYVIGGGDGYGCLTDVDMFDPTVERWIHTPRLSEKRFASAALELDGVIYTVGGYDGSDYLMSAERFDPREACWNRLPSLNIRRGCHSLAVLNQKIYALGGYDGTGMVSSTEIFDPRLSCWMPGQQMRTSQGFAAAAVLDDIIFVIGGVESENNLCETVQIFRESKRWTIHRDSSIKRCFSSAVVM